MAFSLEILHVLESRDIQRKRAVSSVRSIVINRDADYYDGIMFYALP